LHVFVDDGFFAVDGEVEVNDGEGEEDEDSLTNAATSGPGNWYAPPPMLYTCAFQYQCNS
jgi:hypothetical protein